MEKHSSESSSPHSAGAAGLSTSLEGSAESAASPRWTCPQGQVPIDPRKNSRAKAEWKAAQIHLEVCRPGSRNSTPDLSLGGLLLCWRRQAQGKCVQRRLQVRTRWLPATQGCDIGPTKSWEGPGRKQTHECNMSHYTETRWVSWGSRACCPSSPPP